MKIIYSDMKLPSRFNKSFNKSVFLAGPTPRDDKTQSWRKSAIKILEENEYNGTIFIPERQDWKVKFEYEDQVEWELEALNKVDTILFWVPRKLTTMPSFTTNVEFGLFITDLDVRLLYGRPDDAPENRYLDYLYERERGLEVPIFNKLEDLIKEVANEC